MTRKMNMKKKNTKTKKNTKKNTKKTKKVLRLCGWEPDNKKKKKQR